MPRTLIILSSVALLFLPSQTLAQKGGGPTGVIVSPVYKQSFTDHIEALGTTKSNETVTITSDTSEKVTAIHFTEGQPVKKGDLLVTLDKGEEDAELKAAMAQLSEARSAYDRAKSLEAASALSQATMLQREATMRERQAQMETIKARIGKRAISAPFDGITGLRHVSVGTLVQPGHPITTIDDISQIKVDFDVPSVYLASLKEGLPVTGTVEAFGDRVFTGNVKIINTQIDPVTRTVTVRAVIPNEDGVLKPGLLMYITLLKDQRDALLIPEEALIKRGENNYVFVVENKDSKKIARQTEIQIGGRRPGIIEVLSGLQAGDKIISHGTVKIADGAEVSIKATESKDQPLDELLKQKADGSADTKEEIRNVPIAQNGEVETSEDTQ